VLDVEVWEVSLLELVVVFVAGGVPEVEDDCDVEVLLAEVPFCSLSETDELWVSEVCFSVM
jgi:hypothetical protein